MTSKRKALGGSRTSRTVRTGFVVSDAVARNFTAPCPISSTVKRAVVAVLAAIYEYSPVLAAALARVVVRAWPGFRGA